MKKPLSKILLTAGMLTVVGLGLFRQMAPQESSGELARARFQSYLDNHPYANNNLTTSDIAKMDKRDRPDLAMEQNYLMMVNPNTLEVPYGNTIRAFDYTKQRLRLNKAQGKIQPNFTPRESGKFSIVRPDRSSATPSPSMETGGTDVPVAISVGGEEAVWKEIGPDNVGGRTRAILWDPNDATNRRVFAGGVAGGLWYNDNVTDANSSWQYVDDFLANLAITSLVADPTNSMTFYAGTGEGFGNADAVRGGGIFKSTDGGDTWSLIASTVDNEDFSYVQKVVVTNAGTLLAATRATGSGIGGIYRSTDGGDNWAIVLGDGEEVDGTGEEVGADIEIAANGDIYASTGLRTTGEVWKSLAADDGADGDWTEVTPDAGDPAERIELATAPSDSDVIYAMGQENGGSGVGYVQMSDDGGATWTEMTLPTFPDGCGAETELSRGQAWYDLILAVSPADASVVVAGGVDLVRSDDSGATWTHIGEWYNCSSVADVHADHHAIVFRPGNDNEALFGNDGGVYYSPNVGGATFPTFEPRNKNYAVTQFYAVAAANLAGSNYFLAGAQDNGTQRFTDANGASTTEATGGDGAFCFVDQTDDTYQITSYVYNSYRYSSNGGESFSSITNNQSAGRFINPTDYDNTAGILYSASASNEIRLIRDFKTGTPSSQEVVDLSLNGGQISCLRADANTANRVFIGTGSGTIFRIDDAHDEVPTVTEITNNISNTGYVSSIDIGSSDDELVATYSSFGVTSVWYTSDGGTTWVNKDDDDGLPDIPVRWALFNPNNTEQVMIATELGVWSTNDITAAEPAWEPTNTNLANVRCDMLQYRAVDGMVVVATHGRGIFTTDIFTGSTDASAPTLASLTPANEETEVSPLDANIEIQLSETIQVGTGNVVLRLMDGTEVESIDVTSDQVTAAGTRAIINPTADLLANTSYYVEVDAGAFVDNHDNAFGGISGSTTWSFTTFDGDFPPNVAVPVGIITVDEGDDAMVLDLTSTFNDADNDNSAITLEVFENTNATLVSTSLDAKDLTLTFPVANIGQTYITVRATSNGKTVDDTFVVTVNSADEAIYSQLDGSSNNGELEGMYNDALSQNADNFSVPGGQSWEVSTVTNKAFTLGDDPMNLQSIDVTFYNDDEGAPGTIVETQTITTASNQIIGGSHNSPSLTVRLNEIVDLPTGDYWVSILPTFNANAFLAEGGYSALYAWYTIGDSGDSYAADETVNVFESYGSEMQFTINGTQDISDYLPTVANAIDDIEIFENPDPNPIELDLTSTFTDQDNDDALITLEVVENTNTDLITTTWDGKTLELTVATDMVGEADITIRATSNGLTVDETFNIYVDENIPSLYAQTGTVGDGDSSPSQLFVDFGAPVESADDFVVPDGESWLFRRVYVEGSNRTNPPTQAIVYVYEDNAGVPGSVIFSGLYAVELTTSDSDFRVTIPEVQAPTLVAGTYWLSVQAYMAFNPNADQWYWSYTTPAVGSDYVKQDPYGLFGGGIPPSWTASGDDGALIFDIGGESASVPNTPTGLTVNLDETADISWSDNSSGETGFLVERSVDGGAYATLTTAAADATSYTDNGPFESNSVYIYRIQALGAEGNSGYSNEDGFLTLPAAPNSLAASAWTTESLTLIWATDDGATDFLVDISDDNFSTTIQSDLSESGTSIEIGELSSNSTYQFRVAAENETGESEESEIYETTTLAVAPDELVVSDITSSGFILTWSEEDEVTEFEVDISTDNFETFVSEGIAVSDALTYTFTGLNSNETYQVRVAAVNDGGSSDESETASALTLPAAPVTLASSDISTDEFTIAWTASDESSDFVIDVSTDNFETFVVEEAELSSLTYNSLELSSNTTYQVRVKATNASGSSAYSSVLSVLTLPAAPTATDATEVSDDGFTANWTTPDGAESFLLDVSTDDFATFVSGFEALEVTGTTHAVAGIGAGDFKYRLRSTNATGASENSNEISVSIVLGIAEFSKADLYLYPNPSTGIFKLDINAVEKVEVGVYTIFGQLVKKSSFQRNETVIIDITNQPQGTYIMRISDGLKTGSLSLIKQ
ncbi:fibronectin type III domain-containing protein [Reichenbachiella sp.]|uniref:fibronectin type III domain-containing protein n=1 Tax=Reichenbachiella sp. TaxID=2184521 RepID=UPI003BAE9AED